MSPPTLELNAQTRGFKLRLLPSSSLIGNFLPLTFGSARFGHIVAVIV